MFRVVCFFFGEVVLGCLYTDLGYYLYGKLFVHQLLEFN